ncbi:VWA domain-containing protein [Sphingomonas sp. LHG3406-1]|uniref:vWA domain-containing protein n=1 Tax=Sphingomonas sp. LHG3406-1 TaxID=2804617 RepID=UPI0026281E32|nr:vWA domain-containing protein [Sphingomonas sp. LHG3406-1]
MALASVSATSLAQDYCRRAPLMAPLPVEAQAMRTAAGLFQQAAYAQPDGTPAETQVCPDGSVILVTETCPVPPPPPPPPPAPMAESDGDGADSIVVTGSSVTGYSPGALTRRERRGMRGQGNGPPAGLLTSGDHDDLLNPEHFAWFVHSKRSLGQQISVLPLLDTRRSLTVELRDDRGQPRALERVTLECADGNRLELATASDGRVVFFPELDRLSERLVIHAGSEKREIRLAGGRGGQQHRLVIGGAPAPVRAMDLMVVLDCTGSMGDEIAFLKSELREILVDLKRRHPQLDLRVGLVAYRDIGDDFVTRTYRLSSDLDALQASIAQQRGHGGGDMPEAVDEALARAVEQDWRPEAVKSLMLVADAPPHDDKMGRAWAAAEAARAKGIRIVPVASSGLDDRAEYFMRLSAALTQSRYVFLTDDSGIGNRHKEPEIACYVVTSLASTIRRVLDSQLTGRRLEPREGEVIRVNGDYDQGRCGLPPKVRPVPPPPWGVAD